MFDDVVATDPCRAWRQDLSDKPAIWLIKLGVQLRRISPAISY